VRLRDGPSKQPNIKGNYPHFIASIQALIFL
jgi:hypothetical protein